MLTIAVDIDEVIANLLPTWIHRYNSKYGDSLKVKSITSWAVHNYVRLECGEDVYKLLTAELYDHVLPIPGALKQIQRLSKIGRIIYVSACTEGTLDAKARWLVRHGFRSIPNSAFVACVDKCLIRSDILIDDGMHNILPRVKRGEEAYLIAQPHNKIQAEALSIPRYSLRQAVEYILTVNYKHR